MGKVSLVGAGPGGIAYLTMQAVERLRQAEVLIYDALVDRELLTLLPEHCMTLDVGKRGGQPSMTQENIDHLLVDYAQSYQQVVRLKSGDPFIFGRVNSEIQALRAAGCTYEVIPGLSSALVAPLMAGIPLTDPLLSSCFAICSAHDPTALNWDVLTQLDTLVLLMGAQQLSTILDCLQMAGRSPTTAIAIVQWATRPHQKIWQGTLATILHQTAGETLAPAVIIVGDVVRLSSLGSYYLEFRG